MRAVNHPWTGSRCRHLPKPLHARLSGPLAGDTGAVLQHTLQGDMEDNFYIISKFNKTNITVRIGFWYDIKIYTKH